MHKTIISLSFPDFNWESLSGLPEPVLSTVLHFTYSNHLPSNLSNQTAQLCIHHFEGQEAMDTLVEQCRSFLENTAVRSEIRNLVQSIHASLERMVSLFESNTDADMLVNAARLWQSVKLGLGYGSAIRFHLLRP